jgi:hypothetical protein
MAEKFMLLVLKLSLANMLITQPEARLSIQFTNVMKEKLLEYQELLNRQLAEGQIVKGQKVVVVKGRKVAKGTEGEIFWLRL